PFGLLVERAQVGAGGLVAPHVVHGTLRVEELGDELGDALERCRVLIGREKRNRGAAHGTSLMLVLVLVRVWSTSARMARRISFWRTATTMGLEASSARSASASTCEASSPCDLWLKRRTSRRASSPMSST